MNRISPYYYFNICLSNLYELNKHTKFTSNTVDKNLICYKFYDKNGNKEIKYKNVEGLYFDVII